MTIMFLVVCIGSLALADAAFAATDLQPPATIKVARRFPANDPNGTIVKVDEVDFRTYCVRVLSHEWAPAASFSPAALRAGALAVKSYGWYWASRTTKLADVRAWGADVDDTVNYQVYMESDYGAKYWDAVDAVSGQVLTRNGDILQASYRAGTYDTSASGWYMSQWGTEYWADHGKDYAWMCDYYYHDFAITDVNGGVAAGGASGGQSTVDPEPSGRARLDLIGPLMAVPDDPSRGDKVTIAFTLRNSGAEDATWDRLTVVGRGPNDQVRDFGSIASVDFSAGQYRMFEADRKVDLAGVWRVWLIAQRGDKVVLVGAGEPFGFKVVGPGDGPASGGDEAADTASAEPTRLTRADKPPSATRPPNTYFEGPRRGDPATAVLDLFR